MKVLRCTQRLALALACIAMVLPLRTLAATPAGPQDRPAIVDVALGEGGRLIGQVVDGAGVPQADTPVAVLHQERVVAETKTDPTGYFAVQGLRGGTYQLAASRAGGVFRLWADQTAPPSAQAGALLIAEETVVRGNGAFVDFLTNPWFVAGVIAAAIAVPIALHNNDSSS